jgi:hypothetical protein
MVIVRETLGFSAELQPVRRFPTGHTSGFPAGRDMQAHVFAGDEGQRTLK